MINAFISVWLLGMSVIDCKTCCIPKWLFWSGGGIGLVLCLGDLWWKSPNGIPIGELIRMWMLGMLPGIGLLLVSYTTKAVGYGDGMVLTILGIVTGIERVVLILTAALFLISIFSIVLLLIRKIKRDARLPFLPFVTVGWFLAGMNGGM